MVKAKPQVKLHSYGIYNKWDSDAKALPQVSQFTTQVEAQIDVEFGLIINIKKAKGQKVRYCIYHPNIPDEDGEVMAPFDGEEYIRSNDWDFYLGDTIWAPISNKLGTWRMTIELAGEIIAEKSFELYRESLGDPAQFFRKRGM
ncbi:DUF3859 domain-containing protein [Agarivorans sp. B2Z047]|uniref:DUF3859 domain-containing protein n=1 Tax=Agarivorans sp. B2Z047 TaxID=2652721 RepID=UPI00128D3A39|nr:DUF3859 domain-containing protein [Agarivorans sp. B2Z047]MPW30534.1 DUF3859 domain-containing protein [Agarivorans sp. B2Z047]UQN42245.1 DUF3859 domain-containing protein [Agarivorans sp. B2Z047]